VTPKIKVLIAEDERPTRSHLSGLLQSFESVEIAGESENGLDALEMIEFHCPDLLLLDLEIPELVGSGIVESLKGRRLPLVGFVGAGSEDAVKAFEFNAVDYLLKPVSRERLSETIARTQDRLALIHGTEEMCPLPFVPTPADARARTSYLERIPARVGNEIVLIPIQQVASVVADHELLRITTARNERYAINYRLKDLEARLKPGTFVRLSRGALANVEMIRYFSPVAGGNFLVTLNNDQELLVSRRQAGVLREGLLHLYSRVR
jgi:two-component system LytT family response regulator